MASAAAAMLGHVTEALPRAGDCFAAQHQLDEAVKLATATGERRCLIHLLALDARIADELEEPARTREPVRRAVAEAEPQEALWLQLTATTTLCECDAVEALCTGFGADYWLTRDCDGDGPASSATPWRAVAGSA